MNRESQIAERLVIGSNKWLTAKEVKAICPACGDVMERKGITRVSADIFMERMALRKKG